MIEISERIKAIPPYIFAQIDEAKAAAAERGIDIIDLGIGDPDIPTPTAIVDEMAKAIRKPENHNYPPYQGTPAFRQSVARWYKSRFNVDLDPNSEVLSLIGSKEGIAHACNSGGGLSGSPRCGAVDCSWHFARRPGIVTGVWFCGPRPHLAFFRRNRTAHVQDRQTVVHPTVSGDAQRRTTRHRKQ